MILTSYLIGLAFYCLSVTLSYSDKAKGSQWYFPLGLAFALVCNFLWLYIAKHSPEKSDIYIRGLYWDSMIVGCYTLLPFFYGVRLNQVTILGVMLTALGLILVKIGG